MSRNPRRTHTFMSTEDANSGKKSYWPELEITGSIRNLSPNLWQLTHLTALYLNDNSLQRIPPEIGRLVNLRALDLSSNKLRSLPAELGDLIYLRELLLNQNYLRVLPYELGKLFQLQVLGLQGNPLSKEVMTLYGEPSGTHKLLSYMLDNLQGTPFKDSSFLCEIFLGLRTILVHELFTNDRTIWRVIMMRLWAVCTFIFHVWWIIFKVRHSNILYSLRNILRDISYRSLRSYSWEIGRFVVADSSLACNDDALWWFLIINCSYIRVGNIVYSPEGCIGSISR
ncbi:CCR4-NOT transcription complex subunit 6-like [Anthophora plagiata]